MQLSWTAYAIPGLAAATLGAILAAVVFFVNPERQQNRRLAAFVLSTALVDLTFTWRLLLPDRADSYAMIFVFLFVATISLAPALLFLATLPTPFSAPLRSRAAPWIVGLSAATLLALMFARPELFVAEMRPFLHTPGWEFIDGPVWETTAILVPATFLYGALCAIDAARRAGGGIAQRRARTFALG